MTDVDANGIPCSTQDFDFQLQADVTGASVFAPPSGNLTISCNDPNANTLIQNWLTSATAKDENGNPLLVTHNYTGIIQACGTDLPVIFSSTDHCGNVGTATAHILITDTQAPIWSTAVGNLDRTVSCSDAAGLAAAQALIPVATDLCDPTLLLTKTAGALAAGACPNSGTYTNTWTAKDDCNNVSIVYIQTITINDTTPPVFSTQAQNQTVECDGSGNAAALNNWLTNHGGAVASDACGGAITWANNYLALSDLCGATGAVTVTFTATDVCGNPGTTQATFTIADTQAPVVTCPAPATGTTANNECFSTNVVLGTPTASDNCSINSDITFTNNAPTQFPVGTTNVIWTAKDACGNTSNCTQVVTVTDNNQSPTITCQNDVEEQITANNCSKTGVTIAVPVIADNCPNPVLTWTLTGATTGNGVGPIPASQPFNVGKTRVHYTVTDVGLNTDTCSFQVWIKNLTIPPFTVTCPVGGNKNISVPAENKLCDAEVTIPAPIISNPCNEVFSITFNGVPIPITLPIQPIVKRFDVGTHNVSWVIIDASGTTYTCDQTVTVVDDQIPAFITCPSSFPYPADFGKLFATDVDIERPTYIDDNCTFKLTWTITGATTDASTNPAPDGISFVPKPYPKLNVGTNIITYTLTDASNNKATCQFTVTITSIPDITCLGPITYSTDPDCEHSVLDADVDNPGVPILNSGSQPIDWTWTITNPDGTTVTGGSTTTDLNPIPDLIGPYTFELGTSTITWHAQNVWGSDDCTQTVTVEDKEAPTLTVSDKEFCVLSLIDAVWNGQPEPNPDITPNRPDWYTVQAGSPDLDITALTDNCCDLEDLKINWVITFSDGHPSVSGMGQPSEYDLDNDGLPNPIILWGATNYSEIHHSITYTVTDCASIPNKTVETVDITIKPRPNVIKLP